MKRKTYPWLGTVAGLALGLGMGLGMSGKAEAGCTAEGYLGSICFMAADYCPADEYVKAVGTILPISQYGALSALIGTAYGGDGVNDVAIPDLRGRTAVGVGVGTAVTTQVNRGQQRGSETRTLTLANLPAHEHGVPATNLTINGTLKANSATGTTNSPVGNYPATSSVSAAANFTKGALDAALRPSSVYGTVTTPSGFTTTTTGAGQAFSIIGPRLGLTPCFRTKGLFPPRP
ncbi:MAG: phage tail protein [Magnetovibrionaceae bacterium]